MMYTLIIAKLNHCAHLHISNITNFIKKDLIYNTKNAYFTQ